MKAIWKFQVIGDFAKIPRGAEILYVGMQGLDIYVWALVDTEAVAYPRGIVMYGTGHPIPPFAGKYIGTVIDRMFVWHVFDRGEQSEEEARLQCSRPAP